MEFNNIALSTSSQSNSTASCTFGMQLNGPAVEIDELQIKVEPVQIKGDCPVRKKKPMGSERKRCSSKHRRQ